MTSTKNTDAQGAAKNTFHDCPDWGKGGRFMFDPATGERKRVSDEGEANAAAALEAPVAVAPQVAVADAAAGQAGAGKSKSSK